MTRAFVQFEQNIAHATEVVGLSTAIDASTTSAVNTDELLRFSLVGAVSALDYYVHQLVRELMIEIARGARSTTPAFLAFEISMSAALQVARGDPPELWMDQEVQRQHGHLSFQQPDKIAKALRLVWDEPVWITIAPKIGKTPETLKQELQLIVARRNQIAHEADCDPTPPHTRWSISRADVEVAIETIRSVATAIDASV